MTAFAHQPRVVLADDHVMLLEALARMLRAEFDVVATVSDGQALVAAVRLHSPAVIIADIGMPHMNGLGAAAQIREFAPETRVIFLTMHADAALAAQAFRMGALGYVLKSAAASELTHAILDALQGKRYLSPGINGGDIERLLSTTPAPAQEKRLTPRELEVIRLLAKGLPMKQAARELDITPRTIAFHKYKIMQQLGLKTNADLFQYAQKHGIIEAG